jgi:hypothetical protein
LIKISIKRKNCGLNDGDSTSSPIQQHIFLGGVFDYVTTPLRNQNRINRQFLIDQDQHQEEELRPLFPGAAEKEEEEKEEEGEEEKEEHHSTMTVIS